MFKRNQIQKTLLVSVLAVTATVCVAQETFNSQASITVSNAFNINETNPLSFGTVVVTPGTTESTLLLRPDGTSPVPSLGTGATLTVIAAGAPGRYTIDSAAPFTPLTVITTTTGAVELTNPQAPPTNGEFTLSDITFEEDGTAGAGAVSATISTDVSGQMAFNMGATLTVLSAASGTTFVDGAYVGNYSIEVSY